MRRDHVALRLFGSLCGHSSDIDHTIVIVLQCLFLLTFDILRDHIILVDDEILPPLEVRRLLRRQGYALT